MLGPAVPRHDTRLWGREALAAIRRPRAMAIALAIALTYAFFVGRPAWNQNSRFALTRALVETRSPIIDLAHATTGDKSKREGHFYSDKAPGLSLLATLPYAVFYALRRVRGGQLPAVEVVPLDPIDLAAERAPPPDRMAAGDRLHYNRAWRIAAYVCRVLTVVPLAMLGLAALFMLAYALARERNEAGVQTARSAARIAAWVVVTYALCTPAFVYATGFYGHRPAADLIMLAAAGVYFLPESRALAQRGPLAIGAVLGLAVCIEYTAAPVVLVICAWAALRHGPRPTAMIAAGGLPFAIALAGYHTWAFGHPFATGYDFVYLETFAAGMRVRYGIHAPAPRPALELLFGAYRGLFALSPILLLAVWGWTQAPPRRVLVPTEARRGAHAGLGRVAAVVFVYYWLLNAGYYMWDGGAATGPRHMLPAVPWIALGLVPAYARVPRACFVLAAYSALQALLCAFAGPEAPNYGHPIWNYAFFEFANFGAPSSSSATNLGRFMGLPGPFSLIPLVLLWLSVVPRDRHMV